MHHFHISLSYYCELGSLIIFPFISSASLTRTVCFLFGFLQSILRLSSQIQNGFLPSLSLSSFQQAIVLLPLFSPSKVSICHCKLIYSSLFAPHIKVLHETDLLNYEFTGTIKIPFLPNSSNDSNKFNI